MGCACSAPGGPSPAPSRPRTPSPCSRRGASRGRGACPLGRRALTTCNIAPPRGLEGGDPLDRAPPATAARGVSPT
eukprot:1585763-Pyramimonas_sp.AAC.1